MLFLQEEKEEIDIMTYKYKCGNEVIRVFVWNDDFHNEVSVKDTKTRKSYNRTIRKDENREFFTWNRNKIYLNDWIKISMNELKEKIENGEHVTSDDLCQAIMTDGIENVRFIAPLSTIGDFGFFSNGNKFKDTLCKIEERWNREVKENYKIILAPVEPDNSVANSADYYTDDFISLIKCGNIKIAETQKLIHQEQSNEDYFEGANDYFDGTMNV